jgi:hypothetical protein
MNYPVNSGSGGLSKGAEAGIGIASAAALAGSALFWFCIRRRLQREREKDGQSNPYSSRWRTQDTVSSPSPGPRVLEYELYSG